MKQSKIPVWRRSMTEHLNLGSIYDTLYEISENGDSCGYDSDEEGYYNEYKELFDDLALGAENLLNRLIEDRDCRVLDMWDDVTCVLAAESDGLLGYDTDEEDYFPMSPYEQKLAAEEARKRLMRLTKEHLITFCTTYLARLIEYFDIKAAHDALTAIVDELDERDAIFKQSAERIDRLYRDFTARIDSSENFDKAAASLPARMWVE